MSGERFQEVKFDELHQNDTVVLETQNSTYRFSLGDVAQRVGKLQGGEFVNPSFVVVGGTLKDKEIVGDRLKVGGRAVFITSGPAGTEGFRRIVTSEIAQIRVDHLDGTGRRAA